MEYEIVKIGNIWNKGQIAKKDKQDIVQIGNMVMGPYTYYVITLGVVGGKASKWLHNT